MLLWSPALPRKGLPFAAPCLLAAAGAATPLPPPSFCSSSSPSLPLPLPVSSMAAAAAHTRPAACCSESRPLAVAASLPASSSDVVDGACKTGVPV